MINIELPFPPSVNVYYRRSGYHIHISEQGRKFQKKVAGIIKSRKLDFKFIDRLKIEVTLHAPTLRKYDIDNRLKAILDSLQNAGVFLDDEQVDELWIRRGAIERGEGCAVVKITRLEKK